LHRLNILADFSNLLKRQLKIVKFKIVLDLTVALKSKQMLRNLGYAADDIANISLNLIAIGAKVQILLFQTNFRNRPTEDSQSEPMHLRRRYSNRPMRSGP
jgi:hypothetical protein